MIGMFPAGKGLCCISVLGVAPLRDVTLCFHDSDQGDCWL